jgi:LCP family protein required for cell wall assembly
MRLSFLESSRNKIIFGCLGLILLVLSGLACGWSVSALLLSPVAYDPPLVTAPPNASATPTPFEPLQPTGTPTPGPLATLTPSPTPTSIYVWGYFEEPSEPSAIDIPPPMPKVDFPESVVNVVLLGSDQRPTGGGHRTDVIMIASLNPEEGTATLISIPRDLYVYIPGFRVDRINTADARGGPEWVKQTILYNLGIEIDHWVRVNFSGFVSAVDLLGGVNVQVGEYVSDRCGDRDYTFSPGVHHMDGYTALCYVRMRKYTSDFDRLRRQQEVVAAVFERFLSLDGLTRVPELYNTFNSLVQTDVALDDVLPLVPLAGKLASDTSRIERYTLGPNLAQGWRVPYSGASVLLPQRDAILAMLDEAFGS